MSFSKIRGLTDKSDSGLIYYNATIINNNVTTTEKLEEPIITFTDTRQTPILTNASKYMVSVESFNLNGANKTLPIFIPQIDPAGSSINQTIYKVNLGFYSATEDKYFTNRTAITWEPEDLSSFVVTPTQNTPQQELPYYYCYTYSHWVGLMNKALKTAWQTIILETIDQTTSWQCPFFEYDEKTGLFSLNQDAYLSMAPVGTTLPPPFDFAATPTAGYVVGDYAWTGMNENLHGLMSNFNDTYFGPARSWRGSTRSLPEFMFDFGLTRLTGIDPLFPVDGNNVMSLLSSNPQSFTIVNPFTNTEDAAKKYVKSTQNYTSTGGLWSPVASIVLGTTQIPVRNEYVSSIASSGSNVGADNKSGSAFQRVLIETPIDAVTADTWRGFIFYRPLTPTYSMLEDSAVAISVIDISVYWRNRLTNTLIPLRMYNSSSLTIRLLFEKHA